MTTTEYKPTVSLTIHPALHGMPRWQEDDPQFEALARNIHARGFIYPIKITENDLIVDGRHRWWVALRLKFDEVPCQVVPEKETTALIIDTILQRRHYTKGALAYMLVPLCGTKKSQEALAQEGGVSRALIQQATEVRAIFEQSEEGAEYRDFIEPKILAGEIGLGAVIAGWAGRQATKGQSKKIADQVKLWDRTLGDLTNRFKAWDKFGEAEKLQVVSKLGATVESMPTDLLGKLTLKITAEVKRRKEEGK
ncbi:MAG: hypothetical protein ABS95_01215 [Verrucomicrobia bacterium SCN 57-15]|nr:MAG: hypothetical protein ABS95_01215 [Verrucomicrobia bacterium SCN 57-15]